MSKELFRKYRQNAYILSNAFAMHGGVVQQQPINQDSRTRNVGDDMRDFKSLHKELKPQ